MSVPPNALVVTGMFQVSPPLPVVGVPTDVPVAAAPEREKLLAATPVTAELKVSVQLTVAEFDGVVLVRFSEVSVTPAVVKVEAGLV